MASTGSPLSGKFTVKWTGGTDSELNIERTGETQLPDTLENETVELVTNFGTKKDVVEKSNFQDSTVTCFFDPTTYELLLKHKQAGAQGTLTYHATAKDGGFYDVSYTAKILSVGGPSGDVEGNIESFDTTFGIVARIGASGSMGTNVFD